MTCLHEPCAASPPQKVSVPEDSATPCTELVLRDWEQSSRFTEGRVTDILAVGTCAIRSGSAEPPAQRRKAFRHWLITYVLFSFHTVRESLKIRITYKEMSFLKLLGISLYHGSLEVTFYRRTSSKNYGTRDWDFPLLRGRAEKKKRVSRNRREIKEW